MTTMIATHRVADYEAWRRIYDEVVAGPLYDVVREATVWRGQDDPNFVIVREVFDSREVAEAAMSNPVGLEAMSKAGVDMASLEVHYLDQVFSSTD
jgi:hypothetical protein